MIDLIFVTPKDLTLEDYENLREQMVDMDDWDYMLLCYVGGGEYIPERLMGWGIQKHEWYQARLRGNVYDIGIAYH